jgi:hypothetical protein
MSLIGRYLRMGVSVEGKVSASGKGVPQGSPLSPLLANVMSHDLDNFMEEENLAFVRYADDWSATKGANEMVVGPPKPISGDRLQTTLGHNGKEPLWGALREKAQLNVSGTE